MRFSWMLNALERLEISQDISVRKLSAIEINKLVSQTRSRNIFARHSWENNFYIQRLESLSEQTIIEIFLSGDPNSIASKAEQISRILESCILLSSVFTIKRHQLQIKLGLFSKKKLDFDFIIGPKMQYLKSRSRIKTKAPGITIDQRFINRFFGSGFNALFNFLNEDHEIASRVKRSIN